MSRKKTRNKTATRKSATTRSVSKARKPAVLDTQKLEKEIMQTPSALVRLLTKELSSLKKSEKQLKSDLAKASKSVSSATQSLKSSRKNATTSAGKKQLVKAKKVLADVVKYQAVLAKRYASAKNSLDTTAGNLTKMVELSKHLDMFDKAWSKKLKEKAKAEAKAKLQVKAKAKARAKAAKAKQREAAKRATSIHDSSLDFIDQPGNADFETPAFEADAVKVEETVESNS